MMTEQIKNNAAEDELLLQIQDLHVIYKAETGNVNAVNGVNFELYSRETIGLVGETGAGKTTTALAIMRLLPERTGRISQGDILFHGDSLLNMSDNKLRSIRGSMISMIFQDPMSSLNPIKTVGDQILESLKIHNYDNKSLDDLKEQVSELLSLVGIQPRRKNEYPHQFSGGMRQRVGIAIALACEPQILIADEPTTALDVTIQAQVLLLISQLKKKLGMAMIMITHDLGLVAQTCDKVAIMYAGEIIEKGSVEDIFEAKYHHPYTVGLFNSIPDLNDETSTRLKPIEGLMPDPTDIPPGCAFHPRCKHCVEICKEVMPTGVYNVSGHLISCHLFAGKED